jgi:hypothetical protein
MNDRFKFRAWIEKYKKLVNVFRYGNDLGVCEWIWHSYIYDTPDGQPVLDNWGSVDERFSNVIERTKLIDCILEQCTGLKDKNGKLIYEGDYLKTKDGYYCYVVWFDGFWWVKSLPSEAMDLEHSEFYKECEVIGNIHTENINDM